MYTIRVITSYRKLITDLATELEEQYQVVEALTEPKGQHCTIYDFVSRYHGLGILGYAKQIAGMVAQSMPCCVIASQQEQKDVPLLAQRIRKVCEPPG